MQMWPTATASDANSSGAAGYSTESGRHSGTTLTEAVVRLPAASAWPTPSASSYGTNQGGSAGRVGPVRPSLETLVKQWPTPTSRDWKDGANPSEAAPTNGLLGRAAPRDPTTKTQGSLSPAWVEMLMGFPPGWTDIGGPLPAEPGNTRTNHRARSKGGKNSEEHG